MVARDIWNAARQKEFRIPAESSNPHTPAGLSCWSIIIWISISSLCKRVNANPFALPLLLLLLFLPSFEPGKYLESAKKNSELCTSVVKENLVKFQNSHLGNSWIVIGKIVQGLRSRILAGLSYHLGYNEDMEVRRHSRAKFQMSPSDPQQLLPW